MYKEIRKILKIAKKYENIIITGHKEPDFDSFASCLALYSILRKYKQNIGIYINLKSINNSLNKAIQLLGNSQELYNILDEENIEQYITKNTLLIVTDTSNKHLIEYQPLLELDSIVIDHHIVDKKNKINSKYEIIELDASSTSEMITFYFDKLNQIPTKDIATMLLVGIEVDTNGYIIKTTSNTFLASSLLLRMNADNKIKNEILKETREEYMNKNNLIKRAHMINKNTIVCVLDNEIYSKSKLAEIADELIQFEKVESSYVIGKTDKKIISISARSLGKINVQKIMKKLGGGGTETSSAVQLENISLKKAKEKLIEIIK